MKRAAKKHHQGKCTCNAEAASTIRTTRTQLVCTIVASMLTLVGVTIANLDKFKRTTPKQSENRLVTDSKIQRIETFLDKNEQDVQSYQGLVLTSYGLQERSGSAIRQILDSYVIQNREAKERFAKEKIILDLAFQDHDYASVEVSKQKLTRIVLQDASNLQETINKIKQDRARPVHKRAQSPAKSRLDENQIPGTLLNRNPVVELAELLPIKDKTDSNSIRLGTMLVMPDLSGQSVRAAARTCAKLGLMVSARGEGRVRSQYPRPGQEIKVGDEVALDFGKEKVLVEDTDLILNR